MGKPPDSGNPSSLPPQGPANHRVVTQPSACVVDGCDRPGVARGWCFMRYHRWKRTGDLGQAGRYSRANDEPSSIDGCDRDVTARGWCHMHFHRWTRTGDPGPAELLRGPKRTGCPVEGCERQHCAKGLCSLHYRRLWATGDVGPTGLMERSPQD